MELIYTTTSDNLILPGFHYSVIEKNICVIMVHGMSGNILENDFGDVMGKLFSENGIGYIFSHNRGHSFVNNLKVVGTKKPDNSYESRKIGVTYEKFSECVFDIDAWVQSALKFGYKKIILIGHSSGSPKVVRYMYTNKPESVVGVTLMSPGDMVGLAKKPEYQPNYSELLVEAQKNVNDGKPEKILDEKLWDYYDLSSQTFLDMFVENCPADNLPIMRNPEHFTELESIKVPILNVVGEFDDIAIRTLQEDMDLLQSKALGCPVYTKKMIMGANHTYERREMELSNSILEWIKGVL